MYRKENRQVNISVEGAVCEKLYFEHLKNLINKSDRNKYNLALDVRKASPKDYAKRLSISPYKYFDALFHIQDIEDYNNESLAKKFCGIIDEIADTKLEYQLGYSNYTFELWILLHVADMKAPVNHRNQYLTLINNYLIKDCENKFQDLDEYKQGKNFRNILKKYITLDSVFKAIKNAENIVADNKRKNNKVIQYRKVSFYKDNPDTSMHEVVKSIFKICGVSK